MLKLALVSLILPPIFVFGKLARNDLAYFENSNDIESSDFESFKPGNQQDASSVWILDLDKNLLGPLKLRAANKIEAIDFQDAAGPLMYRFESSLQNRPAIKALKSLTINTDLILLKAEILGIVNKFVLSAGAEPDSYLPEDTNIVSEPTLSLCFQGSYSSLILKLGNQQWHYFITPPSPLPIWFYERPPPASADQIIAIPDDVGKDFFNGLLRLLRAFLSHPL